MHQMLILVHTLCDIGGINRRFGGTQYSIFTLNIGVVIL